MCGICGIVDFEGRFDGDAAVRRMTVQLAHRGPDDEGVLSQPASPGNAPRVTLGHRRLSIIDLSPAGHQPMRARTDDTAVVLNGEIYNFQEKRAECADYPFRSRTDTEVILALYERYGEAFVQHLDGMFALALWDGRREKLLLARDRAGKKPLYYFKGERFFVFASEIKALLALTAVPGKPDEGALALYLTFGYVPTPDTIYQGIRKLEPATLMVLDRNGLAHSRPYWRYPTGEVGNAPESVGPAAVKLRGLLTDAVRRRMVADVPLGAFLSGGIDSSIVVGLMSGLSREPVRTFSIGFEGDPAYDESAYARLVAEKFRTHHTEFRVRPRAVELLEKIIWHYDEPFGDSSAIPTYIVSQLTREHVTVALSGDGGDEVFGGYERFAAALWTEQLPRSLFEAGRLLTRLLPAPPHPKSRRRRIKRFFEKAGLPLPDRYLEWNSFFTRGELASLRVSCEGSRISDPFREYLESDPSASLLQRILHLNFRTYLLDDLLVKTDRMSMAHGLEVRCPFLDTGVVEWAARLPDRLKIRGTRLKYILREAFREFLPRQILRRRKMGFGVPLGQWMREDLRDFSHDLLLGPSARTSVIMDRQGIRRFLDEHAARVDDHGQKIWAVLCLEVWLRSLAASETSAAAPAEIHSA